MKFEYNGDEVYIDGYLKENLQIYKNSVFKSNFDCVLIISGFVGSGKSTLAAQIACFFDPNFNINRFYFDIEDFKQALVDLPQYSALIFDEAIEGLLAKENRRFLNSDLLKLLTKVRSKNRFVIIVLPEFFDLDKGIAMSRSHALINCKLVPDPRKKELGRGRFDFYSQTKKRTLYIKGRKDYNYHASKKDFTARFTKYFPCDYNEYEAKKALAISNSLEKKPKPSEFGELEKVKERLAISIEMLEQCGVNKSQQAKIQGVYSQRISDWSKYPRERPILNPPSRHDLLYNLQNGKNKAIQGLQGDK
jgi:hypothetical protein